MSTPVEVRRRGAVLGAVGVAAATVAAAYLTRALTTGSALDWAFTAGLAALGGLFLAGLVDARSPLLVADDVGVRLRRGRSWAGWTWAEVTEVVVHPATGIRDGAVTLSTAAGERPWLRLGLSTRVGVEGDLSAALDALAGRDLSGADPTPGSSRSAAEPPEPPESSPRGPAGHWRDPRPVLAHGISALAARLPVHTIRLLPTLARHHQAPEPGLDTSMVDGALALDPEATAPIVLPELEQLRRTDDLGLPAESPEADLTEAIALPVAHPVIGPPLCQSRARLGLSVAELSARTRIQAHVIEAVERDDFAACGGDFYARGHLRTLARVLGLDAAPLLAGYDELYAAAPPSLGAARLTRPVTHPVHEPAPGRGGPRWSVLVAAVMAVVLAWSVATLIIDGPVPERVPGLGAGSGGVNGAGVSGKAVPVLLRAAGGGAHVVVRDGDGRIAFTGDLAFGASRSLDVVPPVRVDSSDGGLELVVNGEDQGRLGQLGRAASGVFDGG